MVTREAVCYHENGRLASSWTYEDGDCVDGPVISITITAI